MAYPLVKGAHRPFGVDTGYTGRMADALGQGLW